MMRAGPSGSAFRSGSQTTPSCCVQKAWWWALDQKLRAGPWAGECPKDEWQWTRRRRVVKKQASSKPGACISSGTSPPGAWWLGGRRPA